MPYTYAYPHPAVTVDTVIFTPGNGGLEVLLIERRQDPFAGCWAVPGGFVEIDEDLDTAARRELQEETGLRDVVMEQFHTFGAPGRDPRERIISVAYMALVRREEMHVRAASDARDARWFAVSKLPKLAFDHSEVLRRAVHQMRRRVAEGAFVFELLPPRFPLASARTLFESVLGHALDARRFNKELMGSGLLLPVAKSGSNGANTRKLLYRMDRRKHKRVAAGTGGALFSFRGAGVKG